MQPNDTQPGVPPTPETTPTGDSTLSSTPSISTSPGQAPTPSSTPFQPFDRPVGSAAEAPQAPQVSAPQDTPVAGNAPMAQPPKKSKLPLIIIIAIAVVLLAGGGVFAYSALNNNDTKKAADTTSDSKTNTESPAGDEALADILVRTDGTLDLSGTVEGNSSITAQDITAELNEQVNLSNGLSLMITKVERDFTGFNAKYFDVKSDEEVVAVTVVVGSRNTNGNGFSKSALLMQAPSSDKIVTKFVSSLAEVEGMLDVGSGLDQGQQASGRLLYVVKKSESPLALNYTASYKKVGADETVKLSTTFNL